MRSTLSELDGAVRDDRRAHQRLLTAVSTIDADGSWRDGGAANLPSFLAARYEVAYTTARQWVQDARALAERSALDEAFGSGMVSQDQARAVVALTHDDASADGAWIEQLDGWSVDALQREARRATARRLEQTDGGTYLALRDTPDERFTTLRGRLHREDAAAVMTAIDRHIPNDVHWTHVDRHRADALVELARSGLAADPDHDRATVVVHVTADDPKAPGELQTGGFVPAATAERLSCDARIETVFHTGDGTVTGIGRASRKIPPYLMRQLWHRDRGCVFPGCRRTRFVQCHHVVPWSQGGRTDLDNLVLLCSYHHKLLHEGGWSLSGAAGPAIEFVRPSGVAHRPRAPALDTS